MREWLLAQKPYRRSLDICHVVLSFDVWRYPEGEEFLGFRSTLYKFRRPPWKGTPVLAAGITTYANFASRTRTGRNKKCGEFAHGTENNVGKIVN